MKNRCDLCNHAIRVMLGRYSLLIHMENLPISTSLSTKGVGYRLNLSDSPQCACPRANKPLAPIGQAPHVDLNLRDGAHFSSFQRGVKVGAKHNLQCAQSVTHDFVKPLYGLCELFRCRFTQLSPQALR